MTKIDSKEKKWIFPGSLLLLGIIFFWFVGQTGYIEMRDSSSYELPNLIEGIMPLYPFFLNTLKLLFKEDYLMAAAYLQGLFANVCIMLFVCFLVKRFRVKKWEGYLLWVACLLPFSTELPGYVITHVIFTESVSYPLYYLFFLVLLKTVFNRSKKGLLGLFGLAVLLSLVRSQLLLLFLICGCVCIYVFAKENRGKRKHWKVFLAGGAFGAVGIIAGVFITYGMRSLYVESIGKGFEKLYMPVEKEYVAELGASPAQNNTAQFASALVCRGFFEAEESDVKYYKTPEMKEIFRRVYRACDEKEYLYSYAGKGLWMWQDLTKPYIYDVTTEEITRFFKEQDNAIDEELLEQKVSTIKLQLAFTEIRVHFGRFLYHCFRLMVPGFISCVFFNIKAAYLLSHLITAFLYGSALTMGLWICRRRELPKESAVFLFSVIGCCLIFVGVTNLMFYGMQRYFLYQMGIFYCAYYLAFRTIVLALDKGRKKYDKSVINIDNL